MSFIGDKQFYRNFATPIVNFFYYATYYEIINNKNSFPAITISDYLENFALQYEKPLENNNIYFNDFSPSMMIGDINISSSDSAFDIGFKIGSGSWSKFNKFKIIFEDNETELEIGSATYLNDINITLEDVINGYDDNEKYRECVIVFDFNEIPNNIPLTGFIQQNNTIFYIKSIENTLSDEQIENLILGTNSGFWMSNIPMLIPIINEDFYKAGRNISIYKYMLGVYSGLEKKLEHYIARYTSEYTENSQTLTNRFDSVSIYSRNTLNESEYPLNFNFDINNNKLQNGISTYENLIIAHYQYVQYAVKFYNKTCNDIILTIKKAVFDAIDGSIEKINYNDIVIKEEYFTNTVYPLLNLTNQNNILTFFESRYHYKIFVEPFKTYSYKYNNNIYSTTMNVLVSNINFSYFENIFNYLTNDSFYDVDFKYKDYKFMLDTSINENISINTNMMKHRIIEYSKYMKALIFASRGTNFKTFWSNLYNDNNSSLSDFLKTIYKNPNDINGESFLDSIKEHNNNIPNNNLIFIAFDYYTLFESILFIYKTQNIEYFYNKDIYQCFVGRFFDDNWIDGFRENIFYIKSYDSYYFSHFMSIMEYIENTINVRWNLSDFSTNLDTYIKTICKDDLFQNNLNILLGVKNEYFNTINKSLSFT